MKHFQRIITVNLYKAIKTKILWLHILIPLLGIGLAGSYLVYSSWEEREKILSYVQLMSAVFPFMVAVAVTMTFEADRKAGKFQNLLFMPCSKGVSHLGNLLSLFICGMVASILGVAGFGLFLGINGRQSVTFPVYIITGGFLFIVNIAVYLLQYMICYTWGKSMSMGVGIVGSLLSVLMAMAMGDKVWKICPFSYGIRCSSYFLFQYLKPDFYWKINEERRVGFFFVAVMTGLLFLIFFIWSSFWEGTKEKDE